MTKPIFIPVFFPLVAAWLGGGAALAQSYSPTLAPASSNTQTWACTDSSGHGVPYAGFEFSNGVYFETNAHYHGPASIEPVSTVSPLYGYTNALGQVQITINTNKVGQAEYITGTCYDAYGNWASGTSEFAVGYGDLYYNDHPSIWVKIGGDDTGGGTGHGTTAYNRYMTSPAAYGLYNATLYYFANYGGKSPVCTNDMALYIGGKFDICNDTENHCKDSSGNPIYAPWTSPHISHDRGTAADVAGTGPAQGSRAGGNGVNINNFLSACVAKGALVNYSLNESNHAHCQFANPNTFPH